MQWLKRLFRKNEKNSVPTEPPPGGDYRSVYGQWKSARLQSILTQPEQYSTEQLDAARAILVKREKRSAPKEASQPSATSKVGNEPISIDPANEFFDAVRDGNVETVRTLLAKGADPNGQAYEDQFPLRVATDPEILRLLINAGADVNQTNYLGNALSNNCDKGNVENIELLLAAGADPNVGDVHPLTKCIPFAWIDDPIDAKLQIFDSLIAAGADVNRQTEEYKWSALMAASQDGRIDFVRRLLDAGADPLLKDRYGKTAFQIAVEKDRDEVADLLQSSGGIANDLGNLQWAAKIGNLAAVRQIIESGIDANSRDERNVPLINSPALEGRAEIVEYLLSKGADPDATYDGGDTPLCSAVCSGDLATVRALLAAGADVNLRRGYDNGTPLGVAEWLGKSEIATVLRQAGGIS
jgi:ankyrin repeat protein